MAISRLLPQYEHRVLMDSHTPACLRPIACDLADIIVCSSPQVPPQLRDAKCRDFEQKAVLQMTSIRISTGKGTYADVFLKKENQ